MKRNPLRLIGLLTFVVVFSLPSTARAEGTLLFACDPAACDFIVIVIGTPDGEPIVMGTPDGDPIGMGTPDADPIAMGTPDTDPIGMGTPRLEPIVIGTPRSGPISLRPLPARRAAVPQRLADHR